jgi:hypothetical protein
VAAVLTTGADLGPADDPQRSRPHLRWRVRARRATFASAYATAGCVISALRIEEHAGGLVVHVDRADAPPVRWSIPDHFDP